MTIGIVGLGLIGGSFAKAFKFNTKHTVLGFDQDDSTIKLATLVGAVDGILTNENTGSCDFIFIALYPKASMDWLEQNASLLKPDTVVLDCAGTKRNVCACCFELAKTYGFRYIGGHPMAGTQFSGFKYTKENLFDDASMILVPKPDEDILLLERVKRLLVEIGFVSITTSSAAKHDEIIAFTSQLAHVVSNAYMKSPNAVAHKGYSAGSYQDLTRIAKLNEAMWTELFLENADNLSNEIDILIASLTEYSDAIKQKDASRLMLLLKDGRERKERIDNQ